MLNAETAYIVHVWNPPKEAAVFYGWISILEMRYLYICGDLS